MALIGFERASAARTALMLSNAVIADQPIQVEAYSSNEQAETEEIKKTSSNAPDITTTSIAPTAASKVSNPFLSS